MMHIFFCSECGCRVCGKPEAFEGFIAIPVGAFDDTSIGAAAEIFTNYKLD